jgi:hypothetical protein
MEGTTLKDFPKLYRDTWQGVIDGSFGCEELNRFFHIPCHMILTDGQPVDITTATDLLAFNEQRRAAFLAGGVATARLCGSDLTTQGSHTALITANWELLRADGSLERSWRHFYTMIRPAKSWVIVVSAFRSGS